MAIVIPIRVTGNQDLRKLDKRFKEVERSGKKTFRGVDKEAKRLRISTTGLTTALGALRNKFLLIGFATAGAVLGFKKLLTSASDMEEALNLVKQTFGSSADEIIAFSNTAVDKLGISTGAALKFTGEIGSLAKSFGFTIEQTALFSKAIAQLSTDIGSFKNARPEEVFIAIRAATIGSSEPMLRFGADTREAALQQFALEVGLIKVKRQLTSQERALAALGKVAKDNKDSIGDFSVTQNQFANAVKLLNAEIAEFAETTGKAFIDTATKVIITLRVLIREIPKLFEDVPEETKKALPEEGFTDIFMGWMGELFFPGEVGKEFREEVKGLGGQIGTAVIDGATEGLDAIIPNFVGELLAKIDAAIKEAGARDTSAQGLIDQLLSKPVRSTGLLHSAVQELNMELVSGIKAVGVEARLTSEEYGRLQEKIALLNIENLNAVDSAAKMREGLEAAERVTGSMVQNLAQALAFGRDLGDALKAAAIQIGLSFLPGGSLFAGFAHGGSFTVGGSGAPDSQLVAFKATPGERVDITPPGATTNNNTSTINIILPIATFDEFTVRTKVIPALRDAVESGDDLPASRLR